MILSRGGMASSPRHALVVLLLVNFVAFCTAGPLGPLPNVTSSDLGLKEGSCALGDVVYMPGDEFPGTTPCERCACTDGGVQCTKQQCEPRPGCKALHRPDHCCPTYQCECEQEGRVYGNGEKLVDPADPCLVCYCQGGEVVCRRIACFVRDDCTPRLVPGRCCPEYDNCPLRGVTSLPGVSSPIPSVSTADNIDNPPAPPKENIKQEITIKEITPVSEIPVITEVKIKEILPSPSMEVAEYSSSKSPLIPREATSEKVIKETESRTETPSVIEVHSSLPVDVSSSEAIQFNSDKKDSDSPPSKISLVTQDSINTAIYPSNVPIVATMGGPPVTAEPLPVATTKSQIIDDEDTFDHNPAFPPLPDDLAVLRNHEDEIVPEPVEHVPSHDITVASLSPSSEIEIKEPLTTTPKDLPDTTIITTTEKPKLSTEVTTAQPEITISTISTEAPTFKENPMLNLRSAIPTEILNSPSLVPEEITGELDETTTAAPEVTQTTTQSAFSTTEVPKKTEETTTEQPQIFTESKITGETTRATPVTTIIFETTTGRVTEMELEVSTKEQEQTTSSLAKSNVATEVTSQTELSSLPIETSDQNPPEVSENITNDKAISSTINPLDTSSNIPSTSSEVITVSRSVTDEHTGFENVETTEFILTSFGSSETATDSVIKISAEPEKSAAIIDATDGNKNNVLTDLINLVSDVASISDHTEEPVTEQQVTFTSIADSEELIPVNAGYKSKNKNFNQNSITEVPIKSKVNKQKVIEIEDDDSEGVTDSPPPNDKVEPTTRRPIIDNVSDDMNVTETKADKKDIEIITKAYVPTLNRRPTKVVMKKSNEKSSSEESSTVSSSVETATESSASNESGGTSDAVTTGGPDGTTEPTTASPAASATQ